MTDRNAATWRARLAASLLTLAAGLAACGGPETGASSEPAGTPAERTFLSAMVPHHESALEMARAAEGGSRTPRSGRSRRRSRAPRRRRSTRWSASISGSSAPL